VLESDEWRRRIDSIPTKTVRDFPDRALIATLTYGLARVTAALTMKVKPCAAASSAKARWSTVSGALTPLFNGGPRNG
jgi:hypothetical protein